MRVIWALLALGAAAPSSAQTVCLLRGGRLVCVPQSQVDTALSGKPIVGGGAGWTMPADKPAPSADPEPVDWSPCNLARPSRWTPEAKETRSRPTPSARLGDDWRWPLDRNWRISSPYGYRPKIGGASTAKSEFHSGIDIAAYAWTPVYAARPGVVEFAGQGDDFGKVVILRHADGMKSYYGHLNELLVRHGQTIESRVPIGRVGDTGKSTGAHLHFEIRDPEGRSIDPTPLAGVGSGASAAK